MSLNVKSRVKAKEKDFNFNLVRFAKTSRFGNKEETPLKRLSLAEWQTQPWQNESAWEEDVTFSRQHKQSRATAPPPLCPWEQSQRGPSTLGCDPQHDGMWSTARCKSALFHTEYVNTSLIGRMMSDLNLCVSWSDCRSETQRVIRSVRQERTHKSHETHWP